MHPIPKQLMKLFLAGWVAVLTAAVGPARATVHNVSIGNFSFTPPKTTVVPGDTVKWTLVAGFHTTTSDVSSPKAWDSGTMSTPGQTFSVVFTGGDGPGPFPYHCDFHSLTMEDTIFMAAPPAKPTVFTFVLDAKQANACAGTGSAARGLGVAILSPDSTQLSLYIDHNVSGASAAHVHLGVPCVEGGIRFSFSGATAPITGTWAITATDVNRLFNDSLYVNIHSGAFPGGEIRGQIVQEPIKFLFTIDEAQVSAGGTNSFHSGIGIGKLNATSDTFRVSVTHDIPNDSCISGHIHLGAPGVDGATQFGFSNPDSPVNETWLLDTAAIKNLVAGDLYVNIHSLAFPAGEIRGQIIRDDLIWAFSLNEAEANGGAGTGSAATGFCVAELNADQDTLSIYCEHDVVSPVSGHVHYGPPGVEGGVQFGFSSATSPISESWALTQGDLDTLLDGNLYINIHSPSFPAGEIRGQMDQDDIVLNFTLDQAQANDCNGTGSTATGPCTVKLKPGGKELTLALVHNVGSPIFGHIHQGALCVTGPAQFSFTNVTSPIKEIWYLGKGDIINLFQQELYTNIHSGAFPNEEIRGQLIDDTTSCCANRGNVDGVIGPAGPVDVSDLTYLVAFLFSGGATPPCVDEGNVDGIVGPAGPIDVSDLTYLVAFLFSGGSAPPAC
ncbi:MAG TPA: CHRD domain-containing protein [Candidatus Deferrimicrobium sp.]|nr:CHRD domain-containing protein [Candidatus Deferrimicrobium sp.]